MYIKENTKEKIGSSEDVFKIMSEVYKTRPKEEQHKEYFYVVGLNSKNHVLIIDLVGMGTVNFCMPPMREILRTVIVKDCSNFIVVHNHPSGDLEASIEDKDFTRKLGHAAGYIGVSFLDHLIIAEDKYISMADSGLLLN